MNELLGEDLKAFNLEEVQCDALDDLINQHLESSIPDRSVPKNIKEAMESQEAMEAAKKEIDMIKKFKTWKLVDPSEVPSGVLIYTPIWRFTWKSDRQMKARLCFPGHRQRKGIDYKEFSSPTVAMASFCLFLLFCKLRNVTPFHIDIRNAYLHADVSEEVYMRQPPGFVDNEHPNFVCKIEKALYGMHQAGHNWNNLINADLTKFGMK